MEDHLGWKTGYLIRIVALMSVLWAVATAAVASSGVGDIPESLKSWKAWTLYGQEAWFCPDVAGERHRAFCAWPGELRLEVSLQAGGLRFSQSWELQQESAVPLPGNRKYWPQQVMVNGRAHPVLMRDGTPVVWLTKGRHTVSGGIVWSERPQTIDIPENVALVSLAIDGKPALPLERRGKALTLGAQEDTATREGDSLDVQVIRKLSDGIPARLTTRLRLKVSGKAREWSIQNLLPAHFVPVRVASPWAARLDTNGRLQVQVMPGQAVIEIEARLDRPLKSVEPKFSPKRSQEVWSYEAAPALRTTVVSPDKNMLNVDPRQAGVPTEWLSLPAFVVNPGARFQIEERSRGQNEREGQRLTLKRDMWLDFSGKGFFARDRIEGTMRQGWRFDVAAPYILERADSLRTRTQGTSDDLSAALLVTYGADETLTGVEWHQTNVTLNAGVRLAAEPGRIPVTGWQQPFDSVETVLRMPYGYRLIAAPGADSVSDNAWLERWTILDIFLAAFFSLLAWRLFGTLGGLATVVYLTLAMHEFAAPVLSFVAVIILSLLCRALPKGRLRKALTIGEGVALLCFIGAAIVFIPLQIRTALYPQLEGEIMQDARPAMPRPYYNTNEAPLFSEALPEPAAPMAAPEPEMASKPESASQDKFRSLRSAPSVVSKSAYAPELRQRYAQSTVTQTGGGEPAWEMGYRYELRWSGPVTETQSVHLLVSPPWMTRLLRMLVVALLGWLLWCSICMPLPGVGMPLSWCKLRAARVLPSSTTVPLSVLCFVGLMTIGFGFSPPAAAADLIDDPVVDFIAPAAPALVESVAPTAPATATPGNSAFPPEYLLKELKTRLLEAPVCAPNCADVPRVRIEADASQLRVVLMAHVEAASSLALPEPDEQMRLRGVRVGGETRPVLRVRGKNYIALPRGVHQVQLEYTLSGDSASLFFPIRPAQIGFGSAHWQVDGIDEGRLLGETLNFSRVATVVPSVVQGNGEGAGAASSSSVQQFPPFVHVQRDFVFDLDWSVRTKVSRIAPEEGGFTFPVPLLSGEHVTTPEVKVQEGRALAVFAAKVDSTSWSSRLDKVERIELLAPPLTDHAQTWRVTVNPSWHLEWNGVPVTLSGAGEEVMFEFHPLPGEKLILTLKQPAKTEGGIRAIDRVRLENHIGQHATDVLLEFSLRASQGGEHLITLPMGLEVLEVRRLGVPLNLQPRENRLSLPVSPGVQNYALRLRHQEDIGVFTISPAIDLGMPSANIDVHTVLGEQRWILATRGPATGPAVLYWGELLAALLLAFLLAKSGISSIKDWQWFLLVLGFSTFSWMALFTITFWLIAIDWRWRVRSVSYLSWSACKFNAMQAGIAILTIGMLSSLINTVPEGLLGVPDMGIRGYGSNGNHLNWFADRSYSQLPVIRIFSLPIWIYRVLMLAWTLWLATISIRWLSRGLSAWLKNGYWKRIGWAEKKKEEPPSLDAPVTIPRDEDVKQDQA